MEMQDARFDIEIQYWDTSKKMFFYWKFFRISLWPQETLQKIGKKLYFFCFRKIFIAMSSYSLSELRVLKHDQNIMEEEVEDYEACQK